MSEQGHGIPIALLYESREGGEHLRSALAALGASVVYEATAAELDRERLAGSHASVVVVNLDDEDDPALEAVYGLLDDGRYRVVFNDGQVSGSLSGWDQARWSRHLAAKIFGDDIDPPRPADAESVPVRAGTSPAEAAPQPRLPEPHAVPDATPAEALVPAAAEVSLAPPAIDPPAAEPPVQDAALASGGGLDIDLEWDAPALDDSTSPGADFAQDDSPITIELETEPEPEIVGDLDALLVDLDIAADVPTAPQRPDEIVDVELPSFDMPADGSDFDALPGIGAATDFSADFAADLDAAPDAGAAPQQPDTTAKPAGRTVSAPLDWSLEDVIEGAAAAPDQPAKAADFGIETVSPAEYLAPEDAQDPRAAEFSASSSSLELIPLEEAVQPTVQREDHENWFDPDAISAARIQRVWVLGASIGGPEAMREFLGAFPRNYPALFLLAQHLGAEFVDMMARQLGKATVLPVRVPGHGERASHGEVLIVPVNQRLLVGPDGVVVLERLTEELPYSPSIDQVLEDVAERYGDAAGAIIFSGVSDDAVRGCRALAAKGGRVYVQSAESAVVSSMIDAVTESGVVGFTGSPKELAARLLEERA